MGHASVNLDLARTLTPRCAQTWPVRIWNAQSRVRLCLLLNTQLERLVFTFMIQGEASFVGRFGAKRLLARIHAVLSISPQAISRSKVEVQGLHVRTYADSESRDSDTMAMWTWDEEDSEWFSPQPFAAGRSQETEEEERDAKAVIHPFGRGKFKTVAEHVVIPPIVIDAILKGKGRDSPWTWPSEQEQEEQAARPPPKPKYTERMGGVKEPAPFPSCCSGGRGLSQHGVGVSMMSSVSTSPRLKPKVSGRGRALKMRAERYGNPLRKPGRLVGSCCGMCACADSVYEMRVCVCVCVCVCV